MARTFKPPATQRVYDVCVIGSRLAGVTAGALLARRGFRVLHVDHEAPAGSYEEGGYLLPAAPVLLPSPRFLPAAQAALTELGLTTDLARQLEPVVPDFQVILPRHRLDLPRDAAARAAELRREWPADAERLEGALSELQRLFDAATPFLKAFPPLPPTGLRERWALLRARRFAASAPGAPVALLGEPRAFRELGAHPLATALRAANRFLGHLDGEPSALGLTRILGAALRGTHRLPGGKDALCEMLRRKIAESRGELLGGDGGPAVAEAMELDGRRVAAVRLAGSKDAYVARAFVVATEAAALRALLPREGSARLATLLQAARPSHLLLTVNLVVKAGALPPGLGEAALVLRGEAGPDALGGASLLQILPARRAAKKGPAESVADERVICAAAFVPASTQQGGDAALAAMAARVQAAATEALPFFDRHLVRVSVPALAAPPEARGARLLAHPLYEVDLPQALGVTGLPSRTPIRNLFFAGREVVPGLGLEGEFHAGLRAAGQAAVLLGKKNLPK